MAAAEVATSGQGEFPLDAKEEGSWASEKMHNLGSAESCSWEGGSCVSSNPISRSLPQERRLLPATAIQESDDRDDAAPTAEF